MTPLSSETFTQIKSVLDAGNVFAYPTETVYGLGADPFQRKAYDRVMILKGRSLHQTPVILIPDRTWVSRMTRQVSPLAMKLMDTFWPGPLTLVLEASREVPSWLLRDDETVALRHSSHPWVQSFLEHYGKPIISTSANLTGRPSARSLDEVRKTFGSSVDFYADGGTLSSSKSSTIISLKHSSIQLLREGDISLEQLKKFAHG